MTDRIAEAALAAARQHKDEMDRAILAAAVAASRAYAREHGIPDPMPPTLMEDFE